jgi:hypothetical protein
MMIASSAFKADPPEVDGRFNVTETHVASDGQEFAYAYLCDPRVTDPQLVLEERAALIEPILAAREAARQLVLGTSVPLTRYEFLNRFTAPERVAIRQGALSDPFIEDYMEMMKLSGNVSLVLARPGLAYLASKGIITAERAAAIGAEQ